MQGLADATPRLQALQEEVDRLIEMHPGSSLQDGLGMIRQEIAATAHLLGDILERYDDKNRPRPTAST
jgi:hypothetical protein